MPYVALVKNKTIYRKDAISVLGVYEGIQEQDIIDYAKSHSPLKIAVTYDSLPRTIRALETAGLNPNIENVYCKSLIPPSLEGPNVFGNDWYFSGKCQYYVPMSAVDDYKKALYWKDLGDNIVGYDFK